MTGQTDGRQSMKKLGILVVGQSPRPEVEIEFRRLVADVDLDLRGCLDGLSRSEIARLEPNGNETTLFTRLPSGEGVKLSKRAVVEHGTRHLDELENSGAQAVLILCTGEFPIWAGRRVLIPSIIMKNFVVGVQPQGHLGVLSPLETQVDNTRKRWLSENHDVTVKALSPNATIKEAEIAVRALVEASPDLVVLDCVSYTREIKNAIYRQSGRPSVLAITTIARACAELLEN